MRKKTQTQLRAEGTKQQLSVRDGSAEYRALRTVVITNGVLDRQYVYYALLSIVIFGMFGISLYEIIITKSLLLVAFWSVIGAFFTVQIAGLLHDAGHRAIFKSVKYNDIVGHICGFFTGMAYNGWRIKHNKHHAETNQEEGDPDLEIPLLSFTEKRINSKTGLARFLRKYQAFLYYPMGILVVFSVRFGSLKYCIKIFQWKFLPEITLFGLSFFLWFILPFLIFDLPKALIFFIVSNMAAGMYLLQVFAPNHKGMPQLTKDQQFSFFEQQIVTSRNIFGNPLVDFVYLGLNYQMEHHLFPNCPRNMLKKAAPHVKNSCEKMGLEYTEVTVAESNRIILSELQKTSQRIVA